MKLIFVAFKSSQQLKQKIAAQFCVTQKSFIGLIRLQKIPKQKTEKYYCVVLKQW